MKPTLKFSIVLLVLVTLFLARDVWRISYSHPSEQEIHPILESVQGLDVGVIGLSPWAVMHMMLVIPETQEILIHGKYQSCIEILMGDELFPGALLQQGTEGVMTVPGGGLFRFELEDHYAQYWALRAQALADASEDKGGPFWVQCSDNFLRLYSIRAGQESEWLIILGALVCQNIDHGNLRQAVKAKLEGVLTEYLEPAEPATPSACGGLHGATGLQLCTLIPDLNPELLQPCLEHLRWLSGISKQFKVGDGYVEWPGLHNPLEELTDRDRVRVLGHLVEWWSYDEHSLFGDQDVVVALRMAIVSIGPDAEKGRLLNREYGELFHAISAIERME